MIDGNGVETLRVSSRQAQILALVSRGETDKAIARLLGLSRATVRTHLQRCYRDNGFQSRSQAAARWSVARLDPMREAS